MAYEYKLQGAYRGDNPLSGFPAAHENGGVFPDTGSTMSPFVDVWPGVEPYRSFEVADAKRIQMQTKFGKYGTEFRLVRRKISDWEEF